MALAQEIMKTGARTVPGGGLMLPLMAAGGIAAAASGRGSKDHEKGVFRVISKGEVGIRTSMGQPRYTKETRNLPEEDKRVKLAEPGARFGFPGLRPLLIVSIQDRSLPLGNIVLEREDGIQMSVDSAVIWGITKALAERSVYRTDTLTTSVGEICQNGIRKAAYQVSNDTLKTPELKDALLEIMHEECDEQLEYYGTDLRGFNLSSFAKTEAQMHKESLAQLVLGQSNFNVVGAVATSPQLTSID
jgi:regulator of protease activity HflC (stomatin/prohibitin superfamily)